MPEATITIEQAKTQGNSKVQGQEQSSAGTVTEPTQGATDAPGAQRTEPTKPLWAGGGVATYNLGGPGGPKAKPSGNEVPGGAGAPEGEPPSGEAEAKATQDAKPSGNEVPGGAGAPEGEPPSGEAGAGPNAASEPELIEVDLGGATGKVQLPVEAAKALRNLQELNGKLSSEVGQWRRAAQDYVGQTQGQGVTGGNREHSQGANNGPSNVAHNGGGSTSAAGNNDDPHELIEAARQDLNAARDDYERALLTEDTKAMRSAREREDAAIRRITLAETAPIVQGALQKLVAPLKAELEQQNKTIKDFESIAKAEQARTAPERNRGTLRTKLQTMGFDPTGLDDAGLDQIGEKLKEKVNRHAERVRLERGTEPNGAELAVFAYGELARSYGAASVQSGKGGETSKPETERPRDPRGRYRPVAPGQSGGGSAPGSKAVPSSPWSSGGPGSWNLNS